MEQFVIQSVDSTIKFELCKEAEQIARQVLPKYWQPRAYVHIDHIPLTATDKPARRQAEQIAKDNA